MNTIKNKIKAVIFDMDGTIVDTERLGLTVARELLKSYGFDNLTQDQEAFVNSLPGMHLPKFLVSVKATFMIDDSIEAIAARVSELDDLHLQGNIQFIEGFEPFHLKLQSHNIPTSIATNALPKQLSRIVQAVKLEQFFGKNIYSIADVDHKAKPDPAVFLHAAQQLGVKPWECVVFEDSIYGFQAAKAAGMKCIAIKNNLNKDILNLVHDAIDSYHEAEDALKRV